MIRSKKLFALILAGAMTVPCYACAHSGSSSSSGEGNSSGASDSGIDPNSVTIPNLQMDDDGLIMELEVKPIENNPIDPLAPAPAVTTYVADDGQVFVAQTDINGADVKDEQGNLVTIPVVTEPTSAAGHNYKSYQALWVDTSKKKDFVFDGEFLVFDVEVNEDAEDGAYLFEFFYTDICNYDGTTLDVDSIPAYIVVGDAEVPETKEVGSGLTIVPETIHVKAGEKAQVVVNVKNNPGFCGFDLQLHYDAVAVNVTSGKAGADFTSTKASLNMHGFE